MQVVPLGGQLLEGDRLGVRVETGDHAVRIIDAAVGSDLAPGAVDVAPAGQRDGQICYRVVQFGPQLDTAMQRVAKEGRGILLYLNQEGRGIGLVNKIRAYELQDQGLDTVEANERLGFKADQRDYGIGAQILSDLGVKTMRLLTNNPRKFVGLQGYGLAVSEAVPLEIPASDHTRRYLKTKKDKLGHKLSSV